MKLICDFPFKTKCPFYIDSIFIVINKKYQLKQPENQKQFNVKDTGQVNHALKFPHMRRFWEQVPSFGVLYTFQYLNL